MNQFEETLITLIVWKFPISKIEHCLGQINTFQHREPTCLDLAIDYELPDNIISEMIRKGATLTPQRSLIGKNVSTLALLCNGGLIQNQNVIIDGHVELWSKFAFDQVKHRASEICRSLQELDFDANRLMKIVFYACLPFSAYVPKHLMWKLVTTVKHWKEK